MGNGSVLALDFGEKKTGVATTDAARIASAPLETIRAAGDSTDLLDAIESLLDERVVATILVGLPLHMDGTEGIRAEASRAFASRVAARLPAVDVVLHDERLTSKEAEHLMREAGIRPRDRKDQRDSWSALVLLRDWIESGEPLGVRPDLDQRAE